MKSLGIAKLVEITEREVYERVGDRKIEQLVECWNNGTMPSQSGRGDKPPHFAGLVETMVLTTQAGTKWHVNRWGDFAPVFFEEFLR